MEPGPDYVYKCPKCGNLLTTGSLNSGNTFGAKVFSDGKIIAPMFPEFPDLTKCKKCRTIFWLSKSTQIGSYHWGEKKDSEWKDVDKAHFLKINDYHNAIKNSMAENKEEELFIRQRLWWAYNDRIRKGKKLFINENDELKWKENANRLINLLDQTDINQKVMKAELHRNLGNFENCVSIIQSIDNHDLSWLTERIINECNRMNRWVIELN